jgi:FkbM family methyltransferase
VGELTGLRFPTASFHALASRIKEASGAKPFALQIGAMDGVKFDLLNPHLSQGGWQALLVEPVPDMFKALQEKYRGQSDIRLANCAVSDHDGTITLRRVDPKAVSEGIISEEALGFTTTMKSGGMLNDPLLFEKHPGLKNNILEVTAPCFTLQSLLQSNAVDTIDLLMIDTEGADWLIAQQLDLTRYRPQLICLEHSSLTQEDQAACIRHFFSHGYSGALCTEDLENFLFTDERK